MEQFIFGIHPVLESLESGRIPEKVLIQKGLQGSTFQKLFALIRKKKIPFQMVPAERLSKVTTGNHQGVIAYISAIEYHSLEDLLPGIFERGETPLLVLLDGVTDVRNLGAIGRSAECAGAHAVVLPAKGSANVTPDAIKASAGALSRIPVCKEANILQSIAFLQACGIRVVACDSKGHENVFNSDLTKPLAIVMGSEDKGVSAAVRKTSDNVVEIPMKGAIGSLNVSVATGIILFEALRQRYH